jgi:hypothetical protein
MLTCCGLTSAEPFGGFQLTVQLTVQLRVQLTVQLIVQLRVQRRRALPRAGLRGPRWRQVPGLPRGASRAHQVRTTPSWPSSWANSSLLQLCSRRNAWANLHLSGQPDTLLAFEQHQRPAARPHRAHAGGPATFHTVLHRMCCAKQNDLRREPRSAATQAVRKRPPPPAGSRAPRWQLLACRSRRRRRTAGPPGARRVRIAMGRKAIMTHPCIFSIKKSLRKYTGRCTNDFTARGQTRRSQRSAGYSRLSSGRARRPRGRPSRRRSLASSAEGQAVTTASSCLIRRES